MAHKILWDFEMQTDHPNVARRLDLMLINKKKRTCHKVDFSIPVDHQVKIKESEEKYLDFAWELRNLWNMEVTVIPIVVGVLGIVSKVS